MSFSRTVRYFLIALLPASFCGCLVVSHRPLMEGDFSHFVETDTTCSDCYQQNETIADEFCYHDGHGILDGGISPFHGLGSCWERWKMSGLFQRKEKLKEPPWPKFHPIPTQPPFSRRPEEVEAPVEKYGLFHHDR